jgi:hypothetical protein
MKTMMKSVLIALGLLGICVALLAGVKSQGVWVISAVAVVLFVLGLLRKEGPQEGTGGKGDQALPGPQGEAARKRDGSDGS